MVKERTRSFTIKKAELWLKWKSRVGKVPPE